MRDFKIEGQLPCPGCGQNLDGAINPEGGDGPQDGDVTFCIYCAAMGVFHGDPVDRIERPTLEQEAEFLADPRVQRLIAVLRMTREMGNK